MSVKSNHFPLRTGDTGASTWTDYETAFPVTRSRKIPFFFNHLFHNSHYPEVYLINILAKGNEGKICFNLYCGGFILFCNVCVCVCVCVFSNVWVCEGFVMCGCVCAGFVMCVFVRVL